MGVNKYAGTFLMTSFNKITYVKKCGVKKYKNEQLFLQVCNLHKYQNEHCFIVYYIDIGLFDFHL